MTRWSETTRALSALLAPPSSTGRLEGLSDAVWRAVLERAADCWLLPVLHWRLEAHGLLEVAPDQVLEVAAAAAELGRQRAQIQRRELSAVVRTLNAAGITPVVLKGSASQITGVYPDPGMRLCGDIDLLVEPTEVARAAGLLEAEGYRPVSGPGWSTPVQEGKPLSFGDNRHAPRLIHPNRHFGLDVHWALISKAYAAALPADTALAGALPISIDGAGARVLQPDHRVIHCIVHLLEANRFGSRPALRQLFELQRLATVLDPDLDWPAIAQAFAGAGLRADLDACLHMTAVLTGMKPPVPLSAAGRAGGTIEVAGYRDWPLLGLTLALTRLVALRLRRAPGSILHRPDAALARLRPRGLREYAANVRQIVRRLS